MCEHLAVVPDVGGFPVQLREADRLLEPFSLAKVPHPAKLPEVATLHALPGVLAAPTITGACASGTVGGSKPSAGHGSQRRGRSSR